MRSICIHCTLHITVSIVNALEAAVVAVAHANPERFEVSRDSNYVRCRPKGGSFSDLDKPVKPVLFNALHATMKSSWSRLSRHWEKQARPAGGLLGCLDGSVAL